MNLFRMLQTNKMSITFVYRDEIAEAQRTNKPSGRCHYCLMISKTCKEAINTIPSRGAPKEEYLFVNAEEEFFYEVKSLQLHLMLNHSQRTEM